MSTQKLLTLLSLPKLRFKIYCIMKKRCQFTILIMCMIYSGLSYCSSELGVKNELKDQTETINETFFSQFSWNPAFGAVSYGIELRNTSTQEQTNLETTETFINLAGLPSGTYTIKVTAKFADQSTSIITEDLIEN